MTLEQRVRNLERENRWMRRTAVVAVAVVAVVVLVGQGKEELPDLEVRSLIVKDEAGRRRIFLLSDDTGTGIFVLDQNGRTRASLSVLPERGYPLLVLRDTADKVSAMLTSGNGQASLSLRKDGKTRARLATLPNGKALMDFRDINDQARVVLGTTTIDRETKADENALGFFDAKGNVIWQAPR